MIRKSILYILIFLLTAIGGALGYNYYKVAYKGKNVEEAGVYYPVNEKGDYSKEKPLSKEQKLAQLKRRMNFRSVIRKGDFYSIKNMKETALQYYLSAYKKLPHDHVIEKKIGDTYFEMKMFQKAYSFYIRIPSSEVDKKLSEKMLKALLYTGNKNMRDEFNKINAPDDIKAYYDKILVCYTGIKNCIEEFKAYSGSVDKINVIKNDLLGFEKIQHTDPNSRYAILAGDFLKNSDYLAAAVVGEETLKKRKDYASVLKVVGYSWYELGDYAKANDFLQRYYTIDPKDITVTYILGIINFYLENYISSNLYYNAAVINGYRPKNELQKRLAYNYYILGEKKNMLKVFRYILDEADSTPDDYAVALYTCIEENELSKAMLWANKGVLKFGESDMLFAFRGWLYRLRGEEENAKKDFDIAIEINPRNAIAIYNYGILAFDKNDYTVAKTYFEDTIEVDKNGTFGDEANYKLRQIEELEKAAQSQTQTGAISTGITSN